MADGKVGSRCDCDAGAGGRCRPTCGSRLWAQEYAAMDKLDDELDELFKGLSDELDAMGTPGKPCAGSRAGKCGGSDGCSGSCPDGGKNCHCAPEARACEHEEGLTPIGGWVICRKCGDNMRKVK